MNIPHQTAEIFKILSKGQFISSNSSKSAIQELYNVIENEQNYEILRDYFGHINFILEKGDEYFYFSRPEIKTDIEKKIETAHKWIDILDFLKTYDNAFGSGYRFSPSEILVRLKTDAELETKLEALNKNKETQQDMLDKVLKQLTDDNFLEIENERIQQYKVLASFKYLENLILTINISG
ncbi:MAG: hypothetical protein FWH18_03740 [Marinilabiliaceae bacterium]|nr:hypothetical protein [Marinilabiliaceae bacterium]